MPKIKKFKDVNTYLASVTDSFRRSWTKIGDISLSIQVGETLYSTPRTEKGPWTCVEIGFPDRRIPEIMSWVEDEDFPTDTVYAYVPVHIVDQLIKDNGGYIWTEK